MADEPVNERPIFPAVVREDARGFGIWATSMIRQLTTVFQQYGYRLNKALLDDDLVKNGGDVLSTDDYQVNGGDVLTADDYQANGGDVLTADDYQANGGDLYTDAQVDALVAGQATGWLTPTLENGWINYGATYQGARYRRSADGKVELQGLVKDGSIASNTVILTLPAGFRPAAQLIFETQSANNPSRIDVNSDGELLTGAGAGSWISICLIFQADQ